MPCLEGQGPSLEPAPTLETFLETYETRDRWHPVLPLLEAIGPVEVEALAGTCPFNPPPELIFGD